MSFLSFSPFSAAVQYFHSRNSPTGSVVQPIRSGDGRSAAFQYLKGSSYEFEGGKRIQHGRIQAGTFAQIPEQRSKPKGTSVLNMLQLPAAMKLGQGNVFTGVYDSVHRGGCLPQCMLGYRTPPNQAPQDQTPPVAATPQDQTPPKTRHPPRSKHHPQDQTPPGPDTPGSRPPR